MASGGDNLGTTWSFASGVLTTTSASAAAVNASVIDTYLASGDLTIEAGKITLDAAVVGGSSSVLTLKSASDIVLQPTRSITSTGGSVVLWANTDGETSAGGVFLRRGVTISTGSGHVWLGGGSGSTTWNGLTVGDGHAVAGTPMPFDDCGSCDAAKVGILFDRATISSANGHIKMAAATDFAYAVTSVGSNSVDAGSGTIEIEGIGLAGSSLASGFGLGLHNARLGSLSHSMQLTSSASGTAIKVTGTGIGNIPGFAVDGAFAMTSTGSGSLELNATTTGSQPGIIAGGYNPGTIGMFAASGDITLNGGSKGTTVAVGVAGGEVTTSRITVGSGGSVAASTSDVEVIGDVLSLNGGGMAVATTGTLTVEPSSNSFNGAFTLPGSKLTLPAGLTGLTVGKTTNQSAVTLDAALSVAGPISVYAGTIDVQSNLTATNGDILLDADVGSTVSGSFDGILIAQPITIQTVGSGDITLIGRSGNTGLVSGISFTNPNTSTLISAGDVTITGRSFASVASGGRGIDFVNDAITAAGSISITGQHDNQSSFGVAVRNTGLTAGSGIALRNLDELNDNKGTVVLSHGSVLNGGSGDITFTGQGMSFSIAGGGTLTTTGAVSLLSEKASFRGGISTAGLKITSASALNLGKSTNDKAWTLAEAYTIAGPVTVHGAGLAVNAALTATGDMNLYASGTVTQSAALGASGLGLHGTGTFTLTNTSNNFVTLAGGSSTTKLGSLSLVDASGGLTIGTVNPTGVYASGPIAIETLSGDITLAQSVQTDDTSADAIVVNAGKSAAIGTPTDGDIVVSGTPTVTTGSGGIAKLFSGTEDGSTGLTTLVGGSANVRTSVDETSTSFSPALAAGNVYALYRAVLEADEDRSTVVASPTTVVADGTTSTTITVTVNGATGSPIAGQQVTLTATSGNSVVVVGSGTSNANGVVTFTVQSSVLGTVTYTASVGSKTITQTATVSFVPGPPSREISTVRSTAPSGEADGESAVIILVRVTDAFGNPVVGERVWLEQDGDMGTITPAERTTDLNGVARFTATSSQAGTIEYSAWLEDEQGNRYRLIEVASVTFVGVPNLEFSQHVSDSMPALGDTIVVRYEVTNTGSGDSEEVVLRGGIGSLRLEVVETTILTPGTIADFEARTWTIPTVRAGGTAVLEFRAVVKGGEGR